MSAGTFSQCSIRSLLCFGDMSFEGSAASRTAGSSFLSRTTPRIHHRHSQVLKLQHRWMASRIGSSWTGHLQSFKSSSNNSHQFGPSLGFLTVRLSNRRNGQGWRLFKADEGKRTRYASLAEGGSAGDSSNGHDGLLHGRTGFWDAMLEPISSDLPENPHKSLINEDLAPVLREQRSFSTWDLASLWVGLVVGIPTYYMAGSLVEMGMAWWQGILTVLAGNVIVLFPMVLSGHGGTKYGIPFPVLSRAAFGVRGANLPSILRALVGCGWFGIQTWIGGQAIFQLVNTLLPTKLEATVVPWLGTSVPELSCFLLFWSLQVNSLFKTIGQPQFDWRQILSAPSFNWIYFLCILFR